MSVNKDHICINRNGDASTDQQSSSRKRKRSDNESSSPSTDQTDDAAYPNGPNTQPVVLEVAAQDDIRIQIARPDQNMNSVVIQRTGSQANQSVITEVESPDVLELTPWDDDEEA